MNTDVLLVFCTFPDMEKARQIGTTLVESQLAACVNLCPGVESIYRWKGKTEVAQEVLGIFKTSSITYAFFETKLRELHPYEVPEIMALKPGQICDKYAEWVIGETRG